MHEAERFMWLGLGLAVLAFMGRFLWEVWGHRAKMRRMDQYQAWLKACTEQEGGLTDMQRHEMERVLFGQNPDYRGPWEGFGG